MIKKELIDSLNLQKEKLDELREAVRKDNFYRTVLYKAGIMPGAIESILSVTDTSGIDTGDEELYIERAKVEWRGFITQKGR